MKKEILIIIILGVIIVLLIGALFFIPSKKVLSPTVSGIEVTSPRENEIISSPLKITGIVNGGGWAGFENQIGTVGLFNSNGDELSNGVLEATTDWTKLPTSFQATLIFDFNVPPVFQNVGSPSSSPYLLFKNENPSGDPSKDKTFSLPVKIK
jgi:hypothetical protein